MVYAHFRLSCRCYGEIIYLALKLLTMNKTIRILDANLNRSREGLRVVEDLVRFIIDDVELASRIKTARHEITSLVKKMPIDELQFLTERDSESDVGMNLNCASEDFRPNISQIASANIHRAQEAMRVLEELSKLYSEDVALQFKKLRFELYGIEKDVLPRLVNDNIRDE